jgi:hypothetical protein
MPYLFIFSSAIKCYQKWWTEWEQENLDCPPELTYCVTLKCVGPVEGAMKSCAQPHFSVNDSCGLAANHCNKLGGKPFCNICNETDFCNDDWWMIGCDGCGCWMMNHECWKIKIVKISNIYCKCLTNGFMKQHRKYINYVIHFYPSNKRSN